MAAPQTAREEMDQMLAEMRAKSGIAASIQGTLERHGGAAGAIIGGVIGAPAGPGGAVGGATLGGMMGKTVPEITRPFLTGEPSRPLMESGPDIAREGATSAASETGGPLAMRYGGQLLSKIPYLGGLTRGASVTPPARRAQQALQSAGSTLTPAQLTESRGLDILENVAEGSLLGGGRIEAVKRGQKEAIEALADRVVDTVGTQMGPSEVSRLLLDTLKGEKLVLRGVARGLYREVDQLAAGVRVDTAPVLAFIKSNLNRVNVQKAIRSALPDFGRKLFSKGVDGKRVPEISFADATAARTALLSFSRRKAITAEDEGIRATAGKIASLLDEAIEGATGNLNPQALEAWRGANKFWAEGMERLESEVVRGVARKLQKEPGKFIPAILQPNSPELIRRVKAAVPEAAKDIERKLASFLIHRATGKTGELSGSALLTSFKTYGEETMEAALTPAAIKELRKLGEIALFIQSSHANQTGTGRMFIQLAQAPALFEVGTGVLSSITGGAVGRAAGEAVRMTSMGILVAPWAVGRIFTNPGFIRLLQRGLVAGPGTREGTRVAAQLSTRLLVGDEE